MPHASPAAMMAPWRPAEPVWPLPKDGSVEVWRSSVSGAPADLAHLMDWLSPEERGRAGRYVFAADRRRAMLSRGLLRGLIARYLGLSPCRVPIANGEHGKPAVPGTLQFNVTHSDDLIAFAFTTRGRIGIDVERIDPKLEVSRLAAGIFSTSELRAFEAVADDERVKAFFTAWTRKEAFLKAVGTGLMEPMDRVEVGVDALAPRHVHARQPNGGPCFSIVDVALRDGYSAAIAIEGETAPGICVRDIEA